MKKRFLNLILLMIVASSLLLTACAKKSDEGEVTLSAEETNDYIGAYNRVLTAQSMVYDLVKSFEKDLTSEENYWEDASYFYVSFNPVDLTDIQYTYYYNEDQCDWATTTKLNTELWGEAVPDTLSYDYLGMNNYRLIYATDFKEEYIKNQKGLYGTRNLDSTYNPDKDWLQTVGYLRASSNDNRLQDKLFEYAHIQNGIVFQTQKERMLVYFKDDWQPIEMPIIKTRTVTDTQGNSFEEQYIDVVEMEQCMGRKISELYYSKLSDNIRPKYYDAEWNYCAELNYNNFLNYLAEKRSSNYTGVTYDPDKAKDIYVYSQYDTSDSLFPVINEIDRNWVIDDTETYSQIIVYKNGSLEIEMLDTLSGKVEYVAVDSNKNVVTDVWDGTVVEERDISEIQAVLKEACDKDYDTNSTYNELINKSDGTSEGSVIETKEETRTEDE